MLCDDAPLTVQQFGYNIGHIVTEVSRSELSFLNMLEALPILGEYLNFFL